MGGEQVTVQNLAIVKVDAERNVLLVKGNVPGPKKALVKVKTLLKLSNNSKKGGIRMPKVTLFNQTGHKLEKSNLTDSIFGIEPNNHVLFEAVIMQRASLRQGTS